MANTSNAVIIATANTFNHWRIRDNLVANDVNEIARGDFVKPAGNVTISDGYMVLNKGTGTTLTVASSARVAGTLSVNSIEADAAGHVYLPGNVVASNRATNALYQVNTNVAIDSASVLLSNRATNSLFQVDTNVAIDSYRTLFSNTAAGSLLQINVANVEILGTLNVGNLSLGGTGASGGLGNTIVLQSYREHYEEDNSVTGTKTLDLSLSNWFVCTLTGSTTFTFTNAATNNVHSFSVVVIQGGSAGYTPSWANTVKWAGGQTPPPTTTAVGNTDIWQFTTYNNGTSYIGTLSVKDAY